MLCIEDPLNQTKPPLLSAWVGFVHGQYMPVILRYEHYEKWLSEFDLVEIVTDLAKLAVYRLGQIIQIHSNTKMYDFRILSIERKTISLRSDLDAVIDVLLIEEVRP